MERLFFQKVKIVMIGLLFTVALAMVHPQSVFSEPPPVAPQLVREGDFAVRLLFELGLGTTDDEVEAETKLGEVGIYPRNGWIADYPVTPDIIGELQKSISDAAASRKISMSQEEALERLNTVTRELGPAVVPHTGEMTSRAESSNAEKYANPTEINNYYYEQGPPVVTYYTPPPDYYYLYGFVPSPFWCSGFWFPGFFILHDFHRTIFFRNKVVFVSNHFTHIKTHRFFRIDPISRFHGRTFAGIGVPRSKIFLPTGIPRSDRRIFHGPREQVIPGGRMIQPPTRPRGMVTPQGPAPRILTPPATGGRAFPRSGPSGITRPPAPAPNRMVSPPSRSGPSGPSSPPAGIAGPPVRGGMEGPSPSPGISGPSPQAPRMAPPQSRGGRDGSRGEGRGGGRDGGRDGGQGSSGRGQGR